MSKDDEYRKRIHRRVEIVKEFSSLEKRLGELAEKINDFASFESNKKLKSLVNSILTSYQDMVYSYALTNSELDDLAPVFCENAERLHSFYGAKDSVGIHPFLKERNLYLLSRALRKLVVESKRYN